MDVPALANSLCAQAFARNVLGFIPDELQAQVLDCYADRVILNCTRQWGKSTVCAAKAVHLAYSEPGSLILVASPSARQSSEFVRKAALFLRKLGIKPRGDGDNDISLALPNGSRIVGIPGIEATVRGFSSVSLMLVDEASRVPDELYRALRPMLAVGGGSLWLLSTPYGKRGFFYNEWANGGNSWTRFRIPATDCPRIAANFLEQERRALGPRYFAQEYMCEFHATNDALFNEAQVRRAITGAGEDRSSIRTFSAASSSWALILGSAGIARQSWSWSVPSLHPITAARSPSRRITAQRSPYVTCSASPWTRPTRSSLRASTAWPRNSQDRPDAL